MSSASERAEQKRRDELVRIREQVENGELTIRQMTPAERAKHPPRPQPPRRER